MWQNPNNHVAFSILGTNNSLLSERIVQISCAHTTYKTTSTKWIRFEAALLNNSCTMCTGCARAYSKLNKHQVVEQPLPAIAIATAATHVYRCRPAVTCARIESLVVQNVHLVFMLFLLLLFISPHLKSASEINGTPDITGGLKIYNYIHIGEIGVRH